MSSHYTRQKEERKHPKKPQCPTIRNQPCPSSTALHAFKVMEGKDDNFLSCIKGNGSMLGSASNNAAEGVCCFQDGWARLAWLYQELTTGHNKGSKCFSGHWLFIRKRHPSIPGMWELDKAGWRTVSMAFLMDISRSHLQECKGSFLTYLAWGDFIEI